MKLSNIKSKKAFLSGSALALLALFALPVSSLTAAPHNKRGGDPYNAAFFGRLGHLDALESLNIVSNKVGNEGIAPIGQLTKLKTLRFTNNGKLTDTGMEKLATLTNLKSFSFVGTGIRGAINAR